MSVFTRHLSDLGFEAIAPDLRGYGKNQVDRAFAMADHLQDLIELLEQQQIRNCIILGWSLGGILALEIALAVPERIAGLVLIATAAKPRGSHPPVPWWQYVNTGLAVLLQRLLPQSPLGAPISKFFGRRSLLQYLLQQHTTFAYDQLAGEGAVAFLRTSKFATRALSLALRQGYDRTSDLAKITIPCLVIAGECDRHITADSSQETATLLLNSTWICYPQAAHLLPWEFPDQILADIDRWLMSAFAP